VAATLIDALMREAFALKKSKPTLMASLAVLFEPRPDVFRNHFLQ